MHGDGVNVVGVGYVGGGGCGVAIADVVVDVVDVVIYVSVGGGVVFV